MSPQMDFRYSIRRNPPQRLERIFTVIALVHIEVVDIEENCAARTAHKFPKEVRFRHLVLPKANIA